MPLQSRRPRGRSIAPAGCSMTPGPRSITSPLHEPSMNAQKRHEIFARLRAHNPEPTTELNWTTPFELLTAVLLSAQATDVGVNKATERLFKVANTPQAILDLG